MYTNRIIAPSNAAVMLNLPYKIHKISETVLLILFSDKTRKGIYIFLFFKPLLILETVKVHPLTIM